MQIHLNEKLAYPSEVMSNTGLRADLDGFMNGELLESLKIMSTTYPSAEWDQLDPEDHVQVLMAINIRELTEITRRLEGTWLSVFSKMYLGFMMTLDTESLYDLFQGMTEYLNGSIKIDNPDNAPVDIQMLALSKMDTRGYTTRHHKRKTWQFIMSVDSTMVVHIYEFDSLSTKSKVTSEGETISVTPAELWAML